MNQYKLRIRDMREAEISGQGGNIMNAKELGEILQEKGMDWLIAAMVDGNSISTP